MRESLLPSERRSDLGPASMVSRSKLIRRFSTMLVLLAASRCAFAGPAAIQLDGDGLRIQEVFLQCRDGGARPFIEIVNTGPPFAYASGFGLTARTSLSLPGFVIANVCGPLTGTWQTGQSLLISPTPFQRFGLDYAADRTLSLPLDLEGGRLTLTRSGTPTPTVLHELVYGDAGVALPPPGASLELQPGGSFAMQPLPDPRRADGTQLQIAGCSGVCPPSAILGLPGGGYSLDPVRYLTNGVNSGSYDLLRGELHIDSPVPGYPSTNILLEDDYTLQGLPAGTPVALTIEWLGQGVAHYACGSFCEGTQASIGLFHVGGGQVGALLTESATVSLPLTANVVAGTPFTLRVESSVGGAVPGGTPPAGSLHGRIRFLGLPMGARIVSCSGFDSDAPTAVELALAEAGVTAGVAHLRWFAADERPRVTVERIVEGGDWTALGQIDADGTGSYAWTDADVRPGMRYAWRLAWNEGPVRRTTAEAWLDVPGALDFGLRGVRPNPTAGSNTIAFTLDRPGDAQADVIDIAGRRVMERRWPALAAGEHTFALARQGDLPPGVYLVRLSQAGRTAHTRLIVTR